MSGAPAKKPTRQKAKRSPARLAGSKKAPANSAAFLAVPEMGADKTPPMTAAMGTRAGEIGDLCWHQVEAAAESAPPATRLPLCSFQPTLTVTRPDGHDAEVSGAAGGTGPDLDLDLDEDGDVVPELTALRALSSGASVSESTLWDHVGLQAGLSVSSATVPSMTVGKGEKK